MTAGRKVSRRGAIALGGLVTASIPAAAALPGANRRVLDAGVHLINSDTVITETLIALPGARLEIASGVTLTLKGDLVAGAERLFSGEGKVDLLYSRVVAARPEWWGAVADNPAIDCLPAFNAGLSAHIALQLGPGDYFLSDTWTIALPNRRVWGIGRTKDARGTRLVRRGATGAVILVGSEQRPSSINAFLWGVDLRWLELGRDRAPIGSSGDADPSAVGLRVRHVADCRFEGLRAQEHAVGYSLKGAVRTYLDDCTAFRSAASRDPRQEMFIGFDMDGRNVAMMAGGNASLYLIDCNASTGGMPTLGLSIGARLIGACADTFLVRLETTSLDHGILVDGRSGEQPGAVRRVGYADLHIESAVLDGCRKTGITMSGLSDQALVDVQTPYIALAAGGETAFELVDCGGNVTVQGGQLIGLPASDVGGRPSGIVLRDTRGVAFDGTKLIGFTAPVEAAHSAGFELIVAINADTGTDGGHPAINLFGCRNGYVRPRLSGRAGAHRAGVSIDRASARITVDATGLDPTTLAAGEAVTFDGKAAPPGRPGPVLVVAPFQS